MERRFAQLAPPFFAPPPPAAPSAAEAPSPVAAQAAASLESLLPAMVKKIAWSGDARRGTVRMELGAGALDGSTVLIHADHGEVSVHLSTPPGVDPTVWRERIQRRLEARGLRVTEVAID